MNIRIINIGDELLIGQVINSNAAVMSRYLLAQGFYVDRTVVIGDNGDAILREISDAFQQVDAVILTGGLGPTKDDITKKVICEYFHTQLVLHQPTLDFVSGWLAGRGVQMSDTNREQAMVPASAVVLPNRCGTAPGLWLEQDGKVLISLPGVPYEMDELMRLEVLPRLSAHFHPGEHYLCKTVQTIGIGESTLSDLLEDWELSLPEHIGLAYLPDSGIVRLRLSGKGNDLQKLEKEMDAEVEKLCALAGAYVFAKEDLPMHEIVFKLLCQQGKTMATAESCTGGYLAHLITSIPGSSSVFKGSVVSYANEIKENILHVSSDDLQTYGAVSQQVVEAMAVNVREKFNTDFALATSGIAGPDGGSPEKPVGTVWIAVATPDGVRSECFHFGNAGGRLRVVYRSAVRAYNMLRQYLQNR
ncbi:MAG: competence/damage-inducible protein A [Bacteroidales bacterium]|nr:competence/damage-inducible protein A [Bacteroidales bacterium]